jgi:hypothetical protein
MIVENFDNLIYGDDGQSPIRPLLIRMLETAKHDGVRLRVDVRSIAQGTVNSRSEHTLFMDPNENDADGLMRILVERLNDSPGEGFLGQIRINFAQAGSSGERYGSWTRTIRSPSTSAGRIGGSHASEDEEGDDEDDNSSESFGRSDPRPMMMGGGFSHGGSGVMLSDEQVRLWMETMMGYVFRSQAQQFAMFERATRMMESYTLRFGFPTHEPGIVEARGGEIPASAAPGSPGPSGFGILPMLLQAATKIAAGGGDEPAPAPQPSTQLVPTGSAGRANGRAMAISGASRMVRALRNQPPVPKRPVEGYEDAPEVEDEGPERGSPQWDDGEEGPSSAEGYEDEGYEGEDEDGGGGGGMPDMTGMSAEEMKAAVINWIRADPSRKAEVMNMLPDLSREIT